MKNKIKSEVLKEFDFPIDEDFFYYKEEIIDLTIQKRDDWWIKKVKSLYGVIDKLPLSNSRRLMRIEIQELIQEAEK